jgi:hypothetical protein
VSELKTVAANSEQWTEKHDQAGEAAFLDVIEADTITVEIVDKNTGKMFRRILPVHYYETSNGLILSGETMEGTPSRIAFFSDTALGRIPDLLGKGPDAPRCGETGEHK